MGGHLHYWIYPGLIVAFVGISVDYLFTQLGYPVTVWGQLLFAFSFSALVGFLALRGMTGSIRFSMALNIFQSVLLLVFGAAALVFRWQNPLHLAPSEWILPNVTDILVNPLLGSGAFALGQSRSPIGDLILQSGNTLSAGNEMALLWVKPFLIGVNSSG